MKELYTRLTEILRKWGYSIAEWGEDELEPIDRTLRLEIVEQNQLAPSFNMWEATFNVVFLSGEWSENASNLSNAMLSLIPEEDRHQSREMTNIRDFSDILTLLDIPQFSDVTVEYNEETAEEEQSVTVTIYYC